MTGDAWRDLAVIVGALVVGPVVAGVALGVAVDAALVLAELRRRGEHRQPAPRSDTPG